MEWQSTIIICVKRMCIEEDIIQPLTAICDDTECGLITVQLQHLALPRVACTHTLLHTCMWLISTGKPVLNKAYLSLHSVVKCMVV